MLAKLNEKCGDDELALRALAHGDGVWLMYFEGELTGDAMWVLHSDFVEFSKLVNTQQAEDKYMHEVTYGNGAWVRDKPPSSTSFFVNSRTPMGCADPP